MHAVLSSIICIGSLDDILRFREYLFWTKASCVQRPHTSVRAWIYCPKEVDMGRKNVSEIMTSNTFLFLMELYLKSEFEGFIDGDTKTFARREFANCSFLFRVSCDWECEAYQRNTGFGGEPIVFSRIDVWTNSQRTYQRNTLDIHLTDNEIVRDYSWMLRECHAWTKREGAPPNDGYIVYVTIKRQNDIVIRDCIISSKYNISRKHLWTHYISNVVCRSDEWISNGIIRRLSLQYCFYDCMHFRNKSINIQITTTNGFGFIAAITSSGN